MTLRSLSFALGALALVACGGNVAVSATTTTGGTGGESTTGGGGDGGTGGATGGSGGTGGVGGGANCLRTTDGFQYTLTSTDGTSIDCSAAQPGINQKAHIEGVVTAAGPTELTIDTCPPNADCIGAFYQLSIQSPGFAMNVAPGTFIQIDVQIDFPWGCSNTIMARNLPTWGGVPSPGGNVPWLIFEASDGANQALDGSPFALSTLALGCHPNAEPGCGLEDEYRFDIHGVSDTSAYQGETIYFDANEGGQVRPLQFRNLRSFETGWCDDYWNWAYWVVPAPLVE
jgi:hypothetical protein